MTCSAYSQPVKPLFRGNIRDTRPGKEQNESNPLPAIIAAVMSVVVLLVIVIIIIVFIRNKRFVLANTMCVSMYMYLMYEHVCDKLN